MPHHRERWRVNVLGLAAGRGMSMLRRTKSLSNVRVTGVGDSEMDDWAAHTGVTGPLFEGDYALRTY